MTKLPAVLLGCVLLPVIGSSLSAQTKAPKQEVTDGFTIKLGQLLTAEQSTFFPTNYPPFSAVTVRRTPNRVVYEVEGKVTKVALVDVPKYTNQIIRTLSNRYGLLGARAIDEKYTTYKFGTPNRTATLTLAIFDDGSAMFLTYTDEILKQRIAAQQQTANQQSRKTGKNP